MEVASLRAEIKSWERAFKADRGRDPTVQDIKDNPAIAEKYKLHKRLVKQCVTPPVQIVNRRNGRDSELTVPSTPPRTATTKLRAPIVPKSKPTQSFDEPSSSNPFSPTKRSSVRQAAITETGRSANVKKEHSRRQRSISPGDPFLSPPELPANKAKRRLHGDPVSPSPTRPEKRRRLKSNVTMLGKDADSFETREKIDVLFVDESPAKADKGKNFKLLFEEKSDFLSSSMKTTHVASQNLFPIFKKVAPCKSSLSFETKTLSSGKAEKCEPRSNGLSDAGLQPSRPGIATKKRRSDSIDVGTNSVVSSVFQGLLPPSPRQSDSARKGNPGSWVRKKAKSRAGQEFSDDEDNADEDDITFIEHSPRKTVKINTAFSDEALGYDDLSLSRDPIYVSRHHEHGDAETLDAPEQFEERIDIDLPESLREILHISSSRSCDRGERALVESLLKGRRSGNEFGEVWGVGEVDDERDVVTDGDDDWSGEGIPWEVGEL